MGETTDFAWETATTLSSFRDQIQTLGPRDREVIVDQAIMLLRNYYVHLPTKIEIYKIDPIWRLNTLKATLSSLQNDWVFHEALSHIFAELHDLHTQYSLPAPFPTTAALLPFKVGAYADSGQTRYVVTDIQDSFVAPLDFKRGTEVLTWGGLPITDAVAAAAARTGGTSQEARLARGLASMTIRPLERQLPPEAPDLIITYRTEQGENSLTCPWRVVCVDLENRVPTLARFTNLDHEGELRRRASKKAYHQKVIQAEKTRAKTGEPQSPYPGPETLKTHLPSIFHARRIDGTQVGYIRIFSFAVPGDHRDIETVVGRFACEFVRLIEKLPQQGLIVDVRGNGGGIMPMAEGILQTLTAKRITPQPLELRVTPAVVGLSKTEPDLSDYVASLGQEGAGYSAALPMSKPEWCNNLGQKYRGPVVLIIDARCYSATDAFAAGFQDHAIGPILGTSRATGAGGANVWTLPDFPAEAGLVQPLPGGASLRVALRRTRRVGLRHGDLVEDVGVKADETHAVTRRDVLEGDADLIAHAVSMLRSADRR